MRRYIVNEVIRDSKRIQLKVQESNIMISFSYRSPGICREIVDKVHKGDTIWLEGLVDRGVDLVNRAYLQTNQDSLDLFFGKDKYALG